jgi:hypothetical protein
MSTPEHFKGKTAIRHVVEAQAKGIIAASEIHGTEIPGSISAATDSARTTAIILLLLNLLLIHSHFTLRQTLLSFIIFILGWFIWSVGRSAWLGWSRLERLHRVLEEEHWEIEHNREQERDELKALYQAKGFEGQLLEDVMDVLMADGDRLLKIMIEEELGLSLEVHEHPLKQSLGAAIGIFLTALLSFACYWIWPTGGLYLAAFVTLFATSWISATFQGNHRIPAIIWNLGLAFLAVGMTYFLFKFLTDMRWL